MSWGFKHKRSDLQRCGALLVSAALFGSGLPPSVAWGRPVSSATLDDPAALRVPDDLGHVVEVFSPQPSALVPQRLILYLQSLHTQPQAQRALARLIAHLRRTTGVALIAVEGGTGPADLSPFLGGTAPPAGRRIIHFLMEQGLLTGPLAYQLLHPKTVQVVGVEDPARYLAHLDVYRDSDARRREAARQLQLVRGALEPLQETLYPPDVRRFVEQRRAYAEGRLAVSDYVDALRVLAASHQVKMPSGGALTRLLRLIELERQAGGTARQRQDREQAVRRLAQGLSYERLARELEAWSGAVTARLMPSDEARQLDRWLTTLALVDELYQVHLSREGWRAYQARAASLNAAELPAFLEHHRRLTPEVRQAWEALVQDLKTPERFYALAFERDEALIANTLRAMEERQARVAILVAGGFHTNGITQRLKAQGVAYAVIAPVADAPVDEARYRQLLMGRFPSMETLADAFLRDASVTASQGASLRSPRPAPLLEPATGWFADEANRAGQQFLLRAVPPLRVLDALTSQGLPVTPSQGLFPDGRRYTVTPDGDRAKFVIAAPDPTVAPTTLSLSLHDGTWLTRVVPTQAVVSDQPTVVSGTPRSSVATQPITPAAPIQTPMSAGERGMAWSEAVIAATPEYEIHGQWRYSPELVERETAKWFNGHVQGWKLHVSFNEAEARQVLEVVLPILHELDIPHKVIRDLSEQNAGHHVQVGKDLAIYIFSQDAERLGDLHGLRQVAVSTSYGLEDVLAIYVALRMDRALQQAGLHAPPSELQWGAEGNKGDKRFGDTQFGGRIAYRYGSFTDDSGSEERYPYVELADGRRVPDSRTRYKPVEIEQTLRGKDVLTQLEALVEQAAPKPVAASVFPPEVRRPWEEWKKLLSRERNVIVINDHSGYEPRASLTRDEAVAGFDQNTIRERPEQGAVDDLLPQSPAKAEGGMTEQVPVDTGQPSSLPSDAGSPVAPPSTPPLDHAGEEGMVQDVREWFEVEKQGGVGAGEMRLPEAPSSVRIPSEAFSAAALNGTGLEIFVKPKRFVRLRFERGQFIVGKEGNGRALTPGKKTVVQNAIVVSVLNGQSSPTVELAAQPSSAPFLSVDQVEAMCRQLNGAARPASDPMVPQTQRERRARSRAEEPTTEDHSNAQSVKDQQALDQQELEQRFGHGAYVMPWQGDVEQIFNGKDEPIGLRIPIVRAPSRRERGSVEERLAELKAAVEQRRVDAAARVFMALEQELADEGRPLTEAQRGRLNPLFASWKGQVKARAESFGDARAYQAALDAARAGVEALLTGPSLLPEAQRERVRRQLRDRARLLTDSLAILNDLGAWDVDVVLQRLAAAEEPGHPGYPQTQDSVEAQRRFAEVHRAEYKHWSLQRRALMLAVRVPLQMRGEEGEEPLRGNVRRVQELLETGADEQASHKLADCERTWREWDTQVQALKTEIQRQRSEIETMLNDAILGNPSAAQALSHYLDQMESFRTAVPTKRGLRALQALHEHLAKISQGVVSIIKTELEPLNPAEPEGGQVSDEAFPPGTLPKITRRALLQRAGQAGVLALMDTMFLQADRRPALGPAVVNAQPTQLSAARQHILTAARQALRRLEEPPPLQSPYAQALQQAMRTFIDDLSSGRVVVSLDLDPTGKFLFLLSRREGRVMLQVNPDVQRIPVEDLEWFVVHEVFHLLPHQESRMSFQEHLIAGIPSPLKEYLDGHGISDRAMRLKAVELALLHRESLKKIIAIKIQEELEAYLHQWQYGEERLARALGLSLEAYARQKAQQYRETTLGETYQLLASYLQGGRDVRLFRWFLYRTYGSRAEGLLKIIAQSEGAITSLTDDSDQRGRFVIWAMQWLADPRYYEVPASRPNDQRVPEKKPEGGQVSKEAVEEFRKWVEGEGRREFRGALQGLITAVPSGVLERLDEAPQVEGALPEETLQSYLALVMDDARVNAIESNLASNAPRKDWIKTVRQNPLIQPDWPAVTRLNSLFTYYAYVTPKVVDGMKAQYNKAGGELNRYSAQFRAARGGSVRLQMLMESSREREPEHRESAAEQLGQASLYRRPLDARQGGFRDIPLNIQQGGLTLLGLQRDEDDGVRQKAETSIEQLAQAGIALPDEESIRRVLQDSTARSPGESAAFAVLWLYLRGEASHPAIVKVATSGDAPVFRTEKQAHAFFIAAWVGARHRIEKAGLWALDLCLHNPSAISEREVISFMQWNRPDLTAANAAAILAEAQALFDFERGAAADPQARENAEEVGARLSITSFEARMRRALLVGRQS